MSAPRILGACRLLLDIGAELDAAARQPVFTHAEANFILLLGPHLGTIARLADIAQEEMGAYAVRLLQEGAVE